LNGLKYDPIYRPAPENMPELAQALLARGADPDAQIKKKFILGPNEVSISIVGVTPFFLAAVAADVDSMQILADGGADPQLGSEEGITPLMAAAGAALGAGAGTLRTRTGSPEQAVKLAVQLGADVNARSASGQTAMHAAAFTGEEAVIQFLADRGARVDVSDRSGQTPWTMAMGISPVLRYRGSYGSHPEAAALLVKLGAVPRTREEMNTLSSASNP
jgi:ankyrin repeat protein